MPWAFTLRPVGAGKTRFVTRYLPVGAGKAWFVTRYLSVGAGKAWSVARPLSVGLQTRHIDGPFAKLTRRAMT